MHLSITVIVCQADEVWVVILLVPLVSGLHNLNHLLTHDRAVWFPIPIWLNWPSKEYVAVSTYIWPYSIPVQLVLLTILHSSRVSGCIWVLNCSYISLLNLQHILTWVARNALNYSKHGKCEIDQWLLQICQPCHIHRFNSKQKFENSGLIIVYIYFTESSMSGLQSNQEFMIQNTSETYTRLMNRLQDIQSVLASDSKKHLRGITPGSQTIPETTRQHLTIRGR